MINFFRQSYAIQYVVIALLAIALWIPAFISRKVVSGLDSPVTPLFNLIDGWLGGSVLARQICAFLLLMFNALIFNIILVNNQVIGKVGTMGAFVFVLLMSLTRIQAEFYPFLLSLFFILLLISILYSTYMSQSVEFDLLKAGISIAFASMCYFPSILLIFWVMVSLPIAKKGNFRLELIPLAGLLFMYFFYFAGVYLFGDFLATIHGYRDYVLQLKISVEYFNLKNILLLLLLVFVAVVMLFGGRNLEKSLSVRVKISMSVLLLLLSVFMLFLGGNVLYNGLIFIALSVLISYEFSYIGNTGWADLLLTLFLLLVFANLYYFKML